MMPWSGLSPNRIEQANEMGTSDLYHDGGLRGRLSYPPKIGQ